MRVQVIVLEQLNDKLVQGFEGKEVQPPNYGWSSPGWSSPKKHGEH